MVRSYHTYKLFDVEWLNGAVRWNCEMPLQQGAGGLMVRAPCRRHTLNTIFGADFGDIFNGPIRTRVLPHFLKQRKLFCQRAVLAVVPNYVLFWTLREAPRVYNLHYASKTPVPRRELATQCCANRPGDAVEDAVTDPMP